MKERKLTVAGLLRRSPRFSLERFRSMQRPESTTEVRRGGGKARAVAGSREEEDREREKNEEGWGEPIYKERCEETGVKIKGEPNNGYSAI